MIDLTTWIRVSLWAAAVWVGAVWVVSALYVAITYPAARAHTPALSLGQTLISAAKEFALAAMTQPLLPWFQAFGRRMGGGDDVPVVLVHGYFQNRVDFLYMAHRLRRSGCGPLFACNFFWPQALERSSDDVRGFIAQVREQTGADRVDLVTHSSGGLFALDIMCDSPELVRRAVLIALPGRGVAWRGPVLGTSGSQLRAHSGYQATRRTDAGPTPTLSVFSVHDNIVHPASTSQIRGARAINRPVEGLGHLTVLYDREVADLTCRFLRDPDSVATG